MNVMVELTNEEYKKLIERINELEEERKGLLLTISDLSRNLSLENTIKTADQIPATKTAILNVKPFFNTLFKNRDKQVKLDINSNSEVIGVSDETR